MIILCYCDVLSVSPVVLFFYYTLCVHLSLRIVYLTLLILTGPDGSDLAGQL